MSTHKGGHPMRGRRAVAAASRRAT